MASNKHELKTATFEDGTCVVLRADPAKPRLLEVIATFYDAAEARDYVRSQKTGAHTPVISHQEKRRPLIRQAAKGKPKQVLAARPEQAFKAQPKLPTVVKAQQTSKAKPKQASAPRAQRAPAAKPAIVATAMSERQTAVLKALRSMMDKKRRVEVRGIELAKAASIPLGSVHSVVSSLEKRRMIRTERQGSALLRPIYEVLQSPGKSASSINGAGRGKEAQAATRVH